MAAEGAGPPGPQLSELESLQLKANKITDDSLDSTRRMITLCEEGQASGIKTIEMLEHQGEQLNRVEQGLDGMNSEMKVAEKHLYGMEKWCGCFVLPWNRADKVKDGGADWNNPLSSDTSKVVGSQPGNKSGNVVADGPQGGYIQRINNDAREDEMEENMQAVGGILGNLKNMAQDMGDEIGRQNKQLDTIGGKAATVDVKVQNANTRTEKLLK